MSDRLVVDSAGTHAHPSARAPADPRSIAHAARRGYDEQRGRLEANERERRQLEQGLQLERDKVKKWEGRLGDIKTPREYAALSREIDIAKKTNEGQSEQAKLLLTAAGELKAALEPRFRDVWVAGEVSNARRQASGHHYFTLKDADGLAASLRCAPVARCGSAPGSACCCA